MYAIYSILVYYLAEAKSYALLVKKYESHNKISDAIEYINIDDFGKFRTLWCLFTISMVYFFVNETLLLLPLLPLLKKP